MPDEQTQPDVQSEEQHSDPQVEQPSEDDKMAAAGFRKVRGAWRR